MSGIEDVTIVEGSIYTINVQVTMPLSYITSSDDSVIHISATTIDANPLTCPFLVPSVALPEVTIPQLIVEYQQVCLILQHKVKHFYSAIFGVHDIVLHYRGLARYDSAT